MARARETYIQCNVLCNCERAHVSAVAYIMIIYLYRNVHVLTMSLTHFAVIVNNTVIYIYILVRAVRQRV